MIKNKCKHMYIEKEKEVLAHGVGKFKTGECFFCGKVSVFDVDSILPNEIDISKFVNGRTDIVSDGCHTFEDLYFHRAMLTASLFNKDKSAWKSKKHHDGTMFENYFIVGIETEKGQATYHYKMDKWELFYNTKEIDKAPLYDGHTHKESIERIYSHFKNF